MKTEAVSARIDPDLKKRMEAVSNGRDAYSPSMSKIIERGIELALKELEKRK